MTAAPLVVGFDLDLTPVGTRAGVAATLAQLEAGAELSGVHEALAAVRRHGGRTLLVTGRSAAGQALRAEALAVEIHHLDGDAWRVGKAGTLREHGATVYVGDHASPAEAARAAAPLSVSVLTGDCPEQELRGAGAFVVLDSLAAFPDWLDEHLLEQRLAALDADLRRRGSVLVAFSGGADSALLLAAAARALGAGEVAAATGYSGSLPQAEREPALRFARGLGVRVLTPATREMNRAGYRRNAGDRCYFCKAELLDVLRPLARLHGLAFVATGTNADDVVAGFRPGIRAAQERGAITPLRDAGLTKQQIRAASRAWRLPTWDKPAAACLSSRVAYGVEVTPYRLARVERAEAAARSALAAAGLEIENLRVRDLGETGNGARARLEVDADLVPAAADAPGVEAAVRSAGFAAVELDPRGFRSGAMNELLEDPARYR